jgi:glycosyltransferase involved in cell wall biosynthesis
VLALASYPELGAGTRFRVTEYARRLAERGIDVELHSLLNDDAFGRFYGGQTRFTKAQAVVRGTLSQLRAVLARPADVVLVQREATLIGPAFVEWLAVRARKTPLVYDIDDAVWQDTSGLSKHPLAARLLKNPGKTWRLVDMASHVITGSRYLARVVGERNPAVTVLPTVVPRGTWTAPREKLDGAFSGPRPVIGWIGSQGTTPTLEVVAPALRKLRDAGYDFEVRLIGAADGYRMPGVEARTEPFRLETQIADFQALDVGLAPLLDIEYSRGKCAFKQVEYMAVGVPSVSTPDGAALEFIRDGENGLLARTTDEWFEALRKLLDDRALRARIACAGRRLVEERLSTEAQLPAFERILRTAATRAA